MSTRTRAALALLFAAALLALGCVPEIKTLNPADGTITSGTAVAITGTYDGVAEANAIVTVNGAPATLVSQKAFQFTATALAPGVNAFLVELRDATKPDVRARRRVVVIRGEALLPQSPVPDAVALRLQESFFEALPMEAIVADLLSNFIDDNEFFQDGIGAELIEDLIDSAGSLDVEISEEDGLRLTLSPDIEVDGEHEFENPGPLPGSITCGAKITVGGTFGVSGDLEPDGADPATLDFSGAANTDFDAGFDIYDPTGVGPCDLVGIDALSVVVTPLLNFVGDVVLPGLADYLAHVVRLEHEVHECGGECPPDAILDFRLAGEFSTVDEEPGGLVAEADARTAPLTQPGVASVAVNVPLPELGPTAPVTGRSYDFALALVPNTLNQLLMAATAEGALDRDASDEFDFVIAALAASFPNVTARIESDVAPFLDGAVVCPSGVAAPRIQIPNLRLHFLSAETPGGAAKPFLSLAVDLVGGARLRPTVGAGGELSVGLELVLGSACSETSMTLKVLLNKTPSTDAEVEGFGGLLLRDMVSDAVSSGIPPLPLDELITLEGVGGSLAEIGLQPVEISTSGAAFQVFGNVLVDGEGGDPDSVTLEEVFRTDQNHGWLVGMEKIGSKLYLAFGEFEAPISKIMSWDLASPLPVFAELTNQVFTAPGFIRAFASDGTDLYAIGVNGVGGDFWSSEREVRRITTGGVVTPIATWPWDNQFASSIYADSSGVYFQRSWRPDSPPSPWYSDMGRAIWRVGANGSGLSRWIGREGDYLPMTADIGRLPGDDFIGLTSWYSEGTVWSTWTRFTETGEIAWEDIVQIGYAENFSADELTTACGGDDVIVAGASQSHTGELWASGPNEGSERRLSIAFPPAPGAFAGIVRSGSDLFVASGGPGGVEIYKLAWACD